MIRTVTAALLLAAAAPATAALTAPETRMAQMVEAETDRSVALLERLVNVNSGTLNLAGVEKVGTMIRAELEPLGFAVRWVPMAQTGRAGHLIATHRGNGRGKRLLLIGHLDTVFEPSSPFQRFVREGTRATGPGVNDCKGGDVVMIAALRAMQAAGTLKDADITVVLTGDEERPGAPIETTRADLIAAGKASDVALDFEGLSREDGRDMGSIARRSSNSWVLTTSGKPGHSSGVGERSGYGAIYEMARILDAFRRDLPEPDLTYNVGVIAGGTTAAADAAGVAITASGKTNVIAATAEARGDMRTMSADQTARIRQKMEAIVARHLPQTDAKIAFSGDGYPPMAPTAGNRALLAKLNLVNRNLGLARMAELPPVQRGAGDIGFVAADLPGLVGLGTAGRGEHAEGESTDLTSLPLQAKRAAILMTRLSMEPRAK